MPIDDRERERRRALVRAHYAAENDHDLERIMATFSKDGVMLYNRQTFPGDETIRWAHGYMGMSAAPGAFAGLRAVIDEEHFTDAETVIEGRVCGKHSSEFLGFAPTQHDTDDCRHDSSGSGRQADGPSIYRRPEGNDRRQQEQTQPVDLAPDVEARRLVRCFSHRMRI